MEMMAMKMVMAMVMLTVSGVACATSLDASGSAPIARWLVSKSNWGVLSTISIRLNGTPWGNVASVSDGPVGNSTGTPYFYLSKLDPTPKDIASNSTCSLSLSEAPLGSCGNLDAENPNCARITLSGKLMEVTDKQDRHFANISLWTRHPEMQYWPEGHNWTFYKLNITDISFLHVYGAAKLIPVADYYNVSFEPAIARY